MILLLIVLIFLIRVGIKITLVGISVSTFVYNRYKGIKNTVEKINGTVNTKHKVKDAKEAVINSAKVVLKTSAKVGKFVVENVLSLLDLALSIVNKFLIGALGYVIVVDAVVFVMMVSAMGYFVIAFDSDNKSDYLQMVTSTIIKGGSTGGSTGDPGDLGDPGDPGDPGTSGGGGGGSTGGSVDGDVYTVLSADSNYSRKASALAKVYSEASSRWGRNVAIGIMANVVAEGSPGKIEGINFGSAFSRGLYPSSRKRVLNCTCSKKGTVTIDYWAQAPCSAHEIAGSTVDSMNDVNAMLSIGGSVQGIGVGSIQWSGGRRNGILRKYQQLGDFSYNSLLSADVEYIMEELSGSYSGVISSCSGKSASECAKIICQRYEVPAGLATQLTTRSTYAEDLSAKLARIGK